MVLTQVLCKLYNDISVSCMWHSLCYLCNLMCKNSTGFSFPSWIWQYSKVFIHTLKHYIWCHMKKSFLPHDPHDNMLFNKVIKFQPHKISIFWKLSKTFLFTIKSFKWIFSGLIHIKISKCWLIYMLKPGVVTYDPNIA